jgi:5-methylcytosine-specific restriction endonuclease McrA
VNYIITKQAPIRLQAERYREFRKQVLRRDGWRCQLCGSMTNLEVHHQQFRSHSGADQEENLITLCFNCHFSTHVSASYSLCRKSFSEFMWPHLALTLQR